jgi:formylglycine-generating enzyme required for sulfatase activity
MEFCFVPAGVFIIGEVEQQRQEAERKRNVLSKITAFSIAKIGLTDAFDNSQQKKDEEEGSLSDYWIGKYPVTNAQFNQFIQAGGYGQDELWTEAKEAGFWKDEKFQGILDNEARDRPFDYGEPFTLDNHPVVGISWYEALAFARWLDLNFKDRAATVLTKVERDEDKILWKGLASNKLRMTLPTEVEWEMAARGVDGRKYPWGSEMNPNLANSREAEIGTTSAVGCFPHGMSVHGSEEMSGNILEWVISSDKNLKNLRGGSFNEFSNDLRCTKRFPGSQGGRGNQIGFRLVVTSRPDFKAP